MKTCVILHNMKVEDKRVIFLNYSYNHILSKVITPIEVTHNGRISFFDFIDNYDILGEVNTPH